MRSIFSKGFVLAAVLAAAPVFAATPDGLITTKAKLSLMTTGGVRANEVHVDTNDGMVVLYGKVPTAEQRAMAETAVSKIDGVREVKNLLQVVSAVDTKRVEAKDDAITKDVNAALKNDPALKDSKVSVKSVDKGLVLLTGKAASISDHYRAVAITDGVRGVTRVATEVVVPATYSNQERFIDVTEAKAKARANDGKNSFDDTRISAAVKMRLWTTNNVPSTEINVDTDNRIVTLFGIVPNAASKALAESEAAKVGGVVKVENQLAIVAPAMKEVVDANDKNVEANLKAIFATRPELKGVEVEVKASTARLTGTVYSTWDQLNAIRIARFASGVRGVENQVVVKDAPAAKSAL